MSKKIYDILPPKLAHKVEHTIKDLEGSKKKKSRKTGKASHKAGGFPLKWPIIAGAVVLLLVGMYLYVALPKADITISPSIEVLTRDNTITADKSVVVADFSKKIIPAYYVEAQQEGSEDFSATGTASNDGQATGEITIYNKISPATSFALREGTHFLSDSGKYFLTLSKVTIPAAKGSTPGSVTVKVRAEESGTDYNIKPSKFSVPKLSGTAYFYTIFAESKAAMTGGYTGNVKKVTGDDLSFAEDELTKRITSQAEETLKSNLTEDDILLNDSLLDTIVASSSSAKEGAIADTFTQTAKVKVSALIIKKADLDEFIKGDIISQLPEGKNYLDKNVDISYQVRDIDEKEGIMTFDLKAVAKTYHSISVNDLVELFKKKTVDEVSGAVEVNYGEKVSSVKTRLWPFWVSRVPNNGKKIDITLDFGL